MKGHFHIGRYTHFPLKTMGGYGKFPKKPTAAAKITNFQCHEAVGYTTPKTTTKFVL